MTNRESARKDPRTISIRNPIPELTALMRTHPQWKWCQETKTNHSKYQNILNNLNRISFYINVSSISVSFYVLDFITDLYFVGPISVYSTSENKSVFLNLILRMS